MTWNLRLVKKDNVVVIRKVYYELMGNPISHAPVEFDSSNPAELKLYNDLARQGVNKPVLEFAV
jgi:hypothetical protein